MQTFERHIFHGNNTSLLLSQVKSSHIYLYSAFHNRDCIKAASQ